MNRLSRYLLSTLLICAALSLVAATPASAQDRYGFVEFFGGLLFIGGDITVPCGQVSIPECGGDANIPDVKGDFDDDTPTFGFAGGYRFNEKMGFKASLSWVDGDDTFGAPLEGSPLEIGLFFVDLSFMYHPWGKNTFFYGGPGLLDIEATIDRPGPDLEADEQKASFHIGMGRIWTFGEKGYFRWQNKARVIDSDIYDDVDVETTIGVGFKFGG